MNLRLLYQDGLLFGVCSCSWCASETLRSFQTEVNVIFVNEFVDSVSILTARLLFPLGSCRCEPELDFTQLHSEWEPISTCYQPALILMTNTVTEAFITGTHSAGDIPALWIIHSFYLIHTSTFEGQNESILRSANISPVPGFHSGLELKPTIPLQTHTQQITCTTAKKCLKRGSVGRARHPLFPPCTLPMSGVFVPQ